MALDLGRRALALLVASLAGACSGAARPAATPWPSSGQLAPSVALLEPAVPAGFRRVPAGELAEPPWNFRYEMAAQVAATGVEHLWVQEGMPALSADGRFVALVDSSGDAYDARTSLLVLAVDGSGAGGPPTWLAESHASDEDEALAAREHDEGARIVAADRRLREGGYRALARMPSAHEPAVAGLPVLAFDPDGWVTIRGADDARTRYRGRLFVPAEVSPEPEDDEAYVEWADAHGCDPISLDLAIAWLVTPARALVRTTSNPAPDGCAAEHTYHFVDLAP